MEFELTNDLIRSYIEYAWGVRPTEGVLHLIGLRHGLCVSETRVRPHEERINEFDDAVGTFGTELKIYSATTDPGATWTADPSNPAGAAHLELGIWDYTPGLHKGRPALVQAEEVCVRRDEDRDAVAEEDEPIDCGFFGINIHDASTTADQPVDSWSAGCQVLVQPGFDSFRYLYESSGQSRFLYHLVDATELGAWVREGGVYPYE